MDWNHTSVIGLYFFQPLIGHKLRHFFSFHFNVTADFVCEANNCNIISERNRILFVVYWSHIHTPFPFAPLYLSTTLTGLTSVSSPLLFSVGWTLLLVFWIAPVFWLAVGLKGSRKLIVSVTLGDRPWPQQSLNHCRRTGVRVSCRCTHRWCVAPVHLFL